MRPPPGHLALVGCTWLVLSCATARLPPGNELEDPETEEAEQPVEVAPALATPGPLDTPPMVATSLSEPEPFAPAPPPESAPAPALGPSTAESSAQARTRFTERLGAARRKIGSGNLADAEPVVDEVAQLAALLGPPELQQSAELAYRLAAAHHRPADERSSADRWLLSCGPDRVDSCRAGALGALGKIAGAKVPESAAARDRHSRITQADSCLRKAEAAARAKAPLPPCLDSAAATYKKLGDHLMVARVRLSRALALHGDPKREGEMLQLMRRVNAECDEVRCAAVRKKALRSISNLLAKAGDLEGSTKALLSEMAVGASTLPPERRPYARTAEVEKACGKLDAKQGAGACRKLEKAALGSYSFRDFSRERAGKNLSPARVRSVNEHFGITLQECLTQEAARLVPPASEKYELRWMVSNEGRVEQLHLGKKSQESGPLAQCLREQFALWRYPRYEGEAQHIEQNFQVSATERTVR